ncbi:MAG: hypothetical protein AAGF92_12610 [Myxococcota bacterium]
MRSTLRTKILVCLCVAWSGGCGDPEVLLPPEPAIEVDAKICGDGGIGFAAHQMSLCCGAVHPGQLVAWELGRFLAVDPSCEFVVTNYVDDSLGTAIGGRLTTEQAEELRRVLSLGDFGNLPPRIGLESTFPPAGTNRYAWGDQRVEFGAGTTRPDGEALVQRFNDLFDEIASRLRGWGRPVEGPVRYVVFSEGTAQPDQAIEETRLEWPLDVPLGLLSVHVPDPGSTFAFPRAWEARDEDAVALKSLREEWLSTQFGRRFPSSIRITETDDRMFSVYIRDVVDFEVDTRPVVPWATTGTLHTEVRAPASTEAIALEVTCDGRNAARTSLELVSTGDDTARWGGTTEGLPITECDGRVVAVHPDRELQCDPIEAVVIPQGWSATRIVDCVSP